MEELRLPTRGSQQSPVSRDEQALLTRNSWGALDSLLAEHGLLSEGDSKPRVGSPPELLEWDRVLQEGQQPTNASSWLPRQAGYSTLGVDNAMISHHAGITTQQQPAATWGAHAAPVAMVPQCAIDRETNMLGPSAPLPGQAMLNTPFSAHAVHSGSHAVEGQQRRPSTSSLLLKSRPLCTERAASGPVSMMQSSPMAASGKEQLDVCMDVTDIQQDDADELPFDEYELRFGRAARCETGACSISCSTPCRIHTCRCCKAHRRLESSSKGYCGYCARRLVVGDLQFVRCAYEGIMDGQRTKCGAEMLLHVFDNHWKQHKINATPVLEDVDVHEGRSCHTCTNMRPVTFYPNQDAACSCKHCQGARVKSTRAHEAALLRRLSPLSLPSTVPNSPRHGTTSASALVSPRRTRSKPTRIASWLAARGSDSGRGATGSASSSDGLNDRSSGNASTQMVHSGPNAMDTSAVAPVSMFEGQQFSLAGLLAGDSLVDRTPTTYRGTGQHTPPSSSLLLSTSSPSFTPDNNDQLAAQVQQQLSGALCTVRLASPGLCRWAQWEKEQPSKRLCPSTPTAHASAGAKLQQQLVDTCRQLQKELATLQANLE